MPVTPGLARAQVGLSRDLGSTLARPLAQITLSLNLQLPRQASEEELPVPTSCLTELLLVTIPQRR
jgi:hypothetical protein